MEQIVLSLRNIGKSFPGVKALDNVSVDFLKGEVHGIVGGNGAGKSTLMKILSGVYSADMGEIYINGEKKKIRNPQDAIDNGQSIIFQEFNLVNALSIAENIYLGRLSNKSGTWIDWKEINQKTSVLMEQIGCNIDPQTKVSELSVAQKQMVEIAKALSYNSNIIIMDEPSATLTNNEVENLFRIVRSLQEKNVTVIYISHKLEEVFEICDRVTVMRNGEVISTKRIDEVTRAGIIQDMVGRPVDQEYPKRDATPAEDAPIVLEGKNLTRKGVFTDVSFALKRGEVLGFAGLVGAGRTEIVRAIFGADSLDSGDVIIKGEKATIKTPEDSINRGIALLTEDRKQQGLILQMPVTRNTTLANLKAICKGGFLNFTKERKVANDYIDQLSIKTPSADQKVLYLSGGNQQKVVLAKWLYSGCDIIILDEPTRGIDVGAKAEIYSIINDLVAAGKSIILISSDMPELLAMSDRVVVIYEGKIKGELKGDDLTADKVMTTMLNEKGE